MLAEKLRDLYERPIELRLLIISQAGVRHRPVGNEISEEKSFGKAEFLFAGEEEFLGLFDFFLSLNFCFGSGHKIRAPANAGGVTNSNETGSIVHR